MTDLYDVAVVGAGIGGLTAAALCQQEGLRTLVLEAHNRPGGCAGDFVLGGTRFPAGATLVSGFEAGGLHDWVYRRLSIPHRATPLDRAMEIVTEDRRFSLWTDRERGQAELDRAFQDDRVARRKLLAWVERTGEIVHRMASRLPVLPPQNLADLRRLAASMRLEVLGTLPYLSRTVGGVMAGHRADRDAEFVQFIDAQLLDATGCESASCAAVNGAIALDLYHRGCFMLPDGTAEIARDLARGLRHDGGEFRFQRRVVTIRQGAGGTWCVRTEDGEAVRARAVVSNTPAWDLPALLGGAKTASLRRAERIRRHGWGAVVLHAAVDGAALPAAPFSCYQTLPSVGEPLTEGGMCFITVLPQGRPGAPRAVSISTHTEADRWWGIGRDAYLEQKAVYTERLLDAGERALPGLRRGLRFQEVATPRTFARYTQRGAGVVGGVRMNRRHALLGSLSHRSGLPGLYICGDSVFPGQGTIGVTLSGINAWRSVRDDLGLGRVRQNALRPERFLPPVTDGEQARVA